MKGGIPVIVLIGCALVACQDPDNNELNSHLVGCESIAQRCISSYQGCIPDIDDTPAHCHPCPEGFYPTGQWAQCHPLYGDKLTHKFSPLMLEPGVEKLGCQVWRLNNEDDLWLNAVEMFNVSEYHHSTWYFVDQEDYPKRQNGFWDNCLEDGFREMDAAVLGGMLSAQCQETDNYVHGLRPGAAIRIPAGSMVVGLVHALNTEVTPQISAMRMVLHSLPIGQVEHRLTPFRIQYKDVTIGPQQTTEYQTKCNLRNIAVDALAPDDEFHFKLHYAFPYTGDLPFEYKLTVDGGAQHGKVLFHVDSTDQADNLKKVVYFNHVFNPPIDLSDANGLQLSCATHNTGDKTYVPSGAGRELCSMVGFAETNVKFDAEAVPISESADRHTLVWGSACNVIGAPVGPMPNSTQRHEH